MEIASRYGVQFVVTIVLARLLVPDDFGLVAMLLVFTSVGAVIVDSGFGAALVQRQRTTADDETTVFLFTTCTSLVVACVLVASSSLIGAFFRQPELAGLIRLTSLVLPLGALAAVPDALLTMRLDFRRRAMAEIVGSCVSGVVAIILAYAGFGVWSMAWQAVVAVALRTAVLWQSSGWRPLGKFKLASFRSLGGFGAYMLFSSLLDVAFLRIQSLLIGKLFPPRELGFYTLAQTTQQAPASFLGSVLNRVGLPVFATIAHDRERLLGMLRVALRVAMFLFVPVMVGVALVAKPLIIMLYGERWVEAWPILSILALGSSIWPVHVLNLAAISAQGRSDLFFRLELLKKTVSIALVVSASHWGVIAIAWSTLAASLFAAIVNTHYTRKLLGYGLGSQMRDQLPTVGLTIIAASLGWLVLHFNQPNIPAMACALAVSAASYLCLAWLGKNAALLDGMALLRDIRRRPMTAPPADPTP